MSTAYPPSRQASGTAIQIVRDKRPPNRARTRPPKIGLLAQGGTDAVYGSTKQRIYSAAEVIDRLTMGYGTPAHLMADALFGPTGDGVGDVEVWLFPLPQPTSGDAAIGTVTPSGTPTHNQEYALKAGEVLSDRFTVVVGDTPTTIVAKMATAVASVVGMPINVTGTSVASAEVKWEGTSGDNVHLEVVEYQDDSEISWAIVQPTGGTGVPDISAALAQIGEQWITHIINPLEYTDDTELDEYMVFGQGTNGKGGRRAPEVHKPLDVFTGTNEADLTTVTTVTEARATDLVNSIIPAPGSHNLPFVIAAEAVREIAVQDNADPAMAYNRLPLTGITPGTDAQQWDSSMRDAAIKAGCSTTKLRDGVLTLEDVVTCYHPTGETNPIYQYVVTQAKHAVVVHELDIMVEENNIPGRPIIGDNETSNNPNALKPKTIKGFLYGVIDRTADAAITTEREYAKENSTVAIDGANPNRVNIRCVAPVSGNAKVISIDYATGPSFGG